MNNPLVSIILPVKNGEKFLSLALESVLEQEYRLIEIVVVDGHSGDRSVEIAQSYPLVRLLSQSGQGLANAWNEGIDAAKGEFIAFLSHDDQWTRNKLRLQVRYLMDHPEIQFTNSWFKFFLHLGCSIPAGFRKELLEHYQVSRLLETLVTRKSIFALVGKFDSQFAVAPDIDWFARVNDHGISTAFVPEVLLYKGIHDANTSMNITVNNQNLLQALRQSIRRKRQQEK